MNNSLWPTASLLEARNAFRRRADAGLARAAETLAGALRARGLRADASSNAGGRAHVHIEGAGLVAREFGTLNRSASPVVAPLVRAHAQEIVRIVAAEVSS